MNLTDVVARGDIGYLKAALSTIPNVSEFVNTPVDDGGVTLLHVAANSTADILCCLLEADANPCCQTEDGLTPLHIAAMWGQKEVVKKLLLFGADSSAVDYEGLMPIDYARNEGHQDCVALLDSDEPASCNDFEKEQSLAESFVTMYETFTTHGDTSMLNYPDVVEDTLLASMDEHYMTAVASPSSSFSVPDVSSQAAGNFSASPSNSSVCSSNSSFGEVKVTVPAEIQRLSNSQLRDRLVSLGEKPGPVNEFTRQAYMVYLTKLESGAPVKADTSSGDKGYKYELALVLNGVSPIPNVKHLEEEVVREFATSGSSHHGTTVRSPVRDNFNYLLLDPRQIEGSSILNHSGDDLSQFGQFVEAIFYVGKGKNSRPVQHLKDAKAALNKSRAKLNSKLDRIASIWRKGFGVISLPMYHNTHSGEAFTRECCMIDTIGLTNLTNQVKGHVHGAIQKWPLAKRRQYGVFLLYKAFRVFKLTAPPQIHQQDL